MWDLNEVKFVEVGKSGIGFRLSQRSVSSVKKFDLRKIVFDDDVVMSSRTPFMTFTPEGDQSFQVIKLRLVRLAVIKELKQTDRTALYKLDQWFSNCGSWRTRASFQFSKGFAESLD